MFPPNQIEILVVVEDSKLQDFITLILIGEDYKVKSYFNYLDALEELNKKVFDLIIADFLSPKVDGLALCKAIRGKPLFSYTPLLLLVPANEPLIKIKAIYAEVDDYVEKPFTSSEELLARVRAILKKVNRYQGINPLTKLPGFSMAIKELEVRIQSKEEFGVGYADLYKFRTFNQRYGFGRGDRLLKAVGELIREVLIDLGTPSDFLAHFGGDDFLFITSSEGIEDICQRIIKDFAEVIPSFYDEEDRENGYIVVKNRKGEALEIPILRIHLGVTTNEHYSFISHAQVFQIITELTDYAKKFEKSIYIKERRKSYPFY
jgi:diguanylate cyclase (GGDEF)-like protein